MQELYSCSINETAHFLTGDAHVRYNDSERCDAAPDFQKWNCTMSTEELETVSRKNAYTVVKSRCPLFLRTLIRYNLTHFPNVRPDTFLTRRAANGSVTLKCWAMHFFPATIGMEWVCGNETRVSETKLNGVPSGDGTYQRWIVTHVPVDEEQRCTCIVHHVALEAPHTVTRMLRLSADRTNFGVVGSVAIACIVCAAFVTLATRRGGCGAPRDDQYRRVGSSEFYAP